MTTSYYRVQDGAADITELMDPERVSSAWGTGADRPGVSVCEDLETLATYLATEGAAIPYGQEGWVLVELEGDEIDADGLDADAGEVLIHATRVVSAQPIPDSFFDMIGEAFESAELDY